MAFRTLFFALPIIVAIVAFYKSPAASTLQRWLPQTLFRSPANSPSSARPLAEKIAPMTNISRTPVYFFSHGGPNVQYETGHPVYPILQQIGREITQKVKPKAVVVFSGHWQSEPAAIYVNHVEQTDLIYDFYGFPDKYYKGTYPNKGSPALADKILILLSEHGIMSRAVKRGLDHGVWSGFNVAFSPEDNPLNVPLVQVSLFDNEDPDMHYRLGEAVAALREEGVVIIGAGMTVHNLRLIQQHWGEPEPLPFTVSFDNALKEAVEAPVMERQDRMREATKRPDARQAHPSMDHLMPVYVAAGAAGEDVGKQLWTLQENCLGWAQYRFGDVPE